MNEDLMAELREEFNDKRVIWHKCKTDDELFYHIAQAVYEIKLDYEKERVICALEKILAKNGFNDGLMRSYISLVDKQVNELMEVVKNDKEITIKA